MQKRGGCERSEQQNKNFQALTSRQVRPNGGARSVGAWSVGRSVGRSGRGRAVGRSVGWSVGRSVGGGGRSVVVGGARSGGWAVGWVVGLLRAERTKKGKKQQKKYNEILYCIAF